MKKKKTLKQTSICLVCQGMWPGLKSNFSLGSSGLHSPGQVLEPCQAVGDLDWGSGTCWQQCLLTLGLRTMCHHLYQQQGFWQVVPGFQSVTWSVWRPVSHVGAPSLWHPPSPLSMRLLELLCEECPQPESHLVDGSPDQCYLLSPKQEKCWLLAEI